MAYIRPPNTILAGKGLTQAPDPETLAPAGVLTVTFNADVATTESLGIVQIGDNINVTVDGIISVADPIPGPTGPMGPAGPQGNPGPTGPQGTYITGDWTPKLISDSGGAAITVTVNCARYVKCGQHVFLTFDFTVASMDPGSSSSFVMLEGLPFKSQVCDSYAGSVIFSFFKNLNSPLTCISGAVIADSFACHMWRAKANVSSLPKLERGDIKATSNFVGSISYISAA